MNLCRKVYAEETHCVRCHQPVDMSLRWPDPMSRSTDHLVPLDQGGAPLDRDNVGLAHLSCNSKAGAKQRWAKQRAQKAQTSTIIIDPRTI